MPVAFTDTPRVYRWLGNQLRAITPALPIFRDNSHRTITLPDSTVQKVGRQIVYRRDGGADITNLAGTYMVRSAWVVYVSQPVGGGYPSDVYVEDLEADADRMNEAIYRPAQTLVDGRYIQECRRDIEHYLPVYDGTTLTEIQLGGIYVILTSLT